MIFESMPLWVMVSALLSPLIIVLVCAVEQTRGERAYWAPVLAAEIATMMLQWTGVAFYGQMIHQWPLEAYAVVVVVTICAMYLPIVITSRRIRRWEAENRPITPVGDLGG